VPSSLRRSLISAAIAARTSDQPGWSAP
jgi:hypothetical protein